MNKKQRHIQLTRLLAETNPPVMVIRAGDAMRNKSDKRLWRDYAGFCLPCGKKASTQHEYEGAYYCSHTCVSQFKGENGHV